MGESFKEQVKKKIVLDKQDPLKELEDLESLPEEEEGIEEEGEGEEVPVVKQGLKVPRIPKPVMEEGEPEEELVKESDIEVELNKQISLLQNNGVYRIQLLQVLDKVVEVLEKQNVNFEKLFKLFEK